MESADKVIYPDTEARNYIDQMRQVVIEAGKVAKMRFDSDLRLIDKAFGDIVTDVDIECESIIINGILKNMPTHQINSEEAGVIAGVSEWSWIVDPLDGTHNYISGIPMFGMIVSLCFNGEPVGAILHDAYQGDMVFGTREGPVIMNDLALPKLIADKPLSSVTIGWTQGYALRDDPNARRVRDRVEASSKRLFSTWSPVIETIKLLHGKFGGMVSYDGEFTDLTAAQALVPGLGGRVARFSRGGEDRRFVVGAKPYVEALLEHIRPLMEK